MVGKWETAHYCNFFVFFLKNKQLCSIINDELVISRLSFILINVKNIIYYTKLFDQDRFIL